MRTPCHTLAALLASSFLFLTVAPAFAGGAEFSIKLATVAPDNTPWSELLKRYKKRVETKAGKERIEVKLFLGGMLGDENETVTKCKRGQIQAVGASTGAMATAVPELNVVELPFLFRNASEADAVIDEASIVFEGDEVEEDDIVSQFKEFLDRVTPDEFGDGDL